jgi:hypothetical protein
MLILNLENASEIPAVAEPLVPGFERTIEVTPAMVLRTSSDTLRVSREAAILRFATSRL